MVMLDMVPVSYNVLLKVSKLKVKNSYAKVVLTITSIFVTDTISHVLWEY